MMNSGEEEDVRCLAPSNASNVHFPFTSSLLLLTFFFLLSSSFKLLWVQKGILIICLSAVVRNLLSSSVGQMHPIPDPWLPFIVIVSCVAVH